MPVIIYNKHCHPDSSWCDEVINVMRPHLLHNPFPITMYRDRNAAILAFEVTFNKFMQSDTPERLEILRLARLHQEGKNIGILCCCSPLPCHADVIKRAIVQIASC